MGPCAFLRRLIRPSGPGTGKGRPFGETAEQVGFSLIGMGISDSKCSNIFSIMNQLVCASSGETPSRTWFQERRDIGGVQATAYAWVKVWFAIRISQLGFDETKIERVPHVDLWCLVKGPDGQVSTPPPRRPGHILCREPSLTPLSNPP